MTKHWFLTLFCLFLALASFSCASKTETINPPAATVEQFGTEKLSMLKDSDGNPIPCSSDADCDGYVDKDDVCIGGTACHNGACSALIYDDCCESDGKDITCPAFVACGNDEECDDENECTNDVCNTYLFDGVCTHGSVDLDATTCGDGVCASIGIETCVDGEWGDTCTPGDPDPDGETCNGLDDDCDSVIDEEDAADCTTYYYDGDDDGFGTDDTKCLCDPVDSYTATEAGDCDDEDPAVSPNADELCNGEDDDCDGAIDEDFPIEMVEMCLVGVGACQSSGHMVCNDTEDGVVCDAEAGTPVDETCNGLDDDCDGATDEELDSTTCGLGVCEHTVANCVAGVPQTCDSLQGAGVESCNGADDDCDGATDEDFVLGAACDGDDGDLCKEGVTVCKADGSGTECNDTTSTDVEVCNGADDDCDGATDEDFVLGAACDGDDGDLCKEGVTVCKADGSGTECNDTTSTDVEVCNGADDDCDGETDEGVLNACGSCGAVPAETCNGLDDDCDGETDEDFSDKGQPCDGGDSDMCKNGTYTCKPTGSWVECINEVPQDWPGYEESCNGVDDDCDGETDEGVLNACGSCGTVPAETCNGLDDDCDGETDEGNPGGGADCGETDEGECELGTLVCDAGKLVCDGAVYPDDEICDGEDNDCDSATDEDDVCSSCNNPIGDIYCGGGPFAGATGDDSWLDGYSCKSTLNESGNEAVFVFNSDFGGLSVMVKPINIDPATADLDVFVLTSCSASSCLKYGNTSATWSPAADTDYSVVVDGYKGAVGEFDLQVTCKETTCNDSKDNDADGAADCADSDCVGKVGCL